MSRLAVPRSLHTSNILGQSQETDSDAESIRCRVVNMECSGVPTSGFYGSASGFLSGF